MSNHHNSSESTRFEEHGTIGVLHFTRTDKRNAINEQLVESLDRLFSNVPEHITAMVITGDGGHFCAGLDLAEHEIERQRKTSIIHADGIR